MRKGAHDVLTTKRDNFNAQIHRGTARWSGVREQGYTVVKDGGGGVFITIHQKADQGLPRARHAFGCVFKPERYFEVHHFPGPHVGVLRT